MNSDHTEVKNSFNTQPPEGGCQSLRWHSSPIIGFNTQPPEGGCLTKIKIKSVDKAFQHTATRRWLHAVAFAASTACAFQHTATRRWLPSRSTQTTRTSLFQHTATRRWLPHPLAISCRYIVCFNTQPPEGGCIIVLAMMLPEVVVSTHSHPKVAAPYIKKQEESVH